MKEISNGTRGSSCVINFSGLIALAAIVALICIPGCYAADTGSGNTKTITDMDGRTLTIPTTLNHVLTTYPPTSNLVYMLAPEKLMGLQTSASKNKYMKDEYKNLPVVGGWYGGLTANYETFMSMNPDAIFEGFTRTGNYQETIDERQKNLNPYPLIEVADSTDVNNYTPSVKFMGEILGGDAKTKADELNSFYTSVYNKVKDKAQTIPQDKRKKVYYAEGVDGLKTEPDNSHIQLVNLCGGINVASKVAAKGGMGETPVNIEDIISWNPDVIIVREPKFYSEIYSDPNWQKIKAVQDKQVYLAPSDPLGWFDRPPCVNTVIGIPWVAKVLYPDEFKDLDLTALTKEFYSKFYHYDLTDSDVKDIMTGSGLQSY